MNHSRSLLPFSYPRASDHGRHGRDLDQPKRRRSPSRRFIPCCRSGELEARQLLDGSGALLFDFGPDHSPVANGYTAVSRAEYDPDIGYGWSPASPWGVYTNDREGWFDNGQWVRNSDQLNRDLIFSHDKTFVVDVDPGVYDITPTMGDRDAAYAGFGVWAEGRLLADGLSTARDQFLSPTFRVAVSDGQLDLRLAGGSGWYFPLNALQIRRVGPAVSAGADQLTVEEGTSLSFTGSASGSGPFVYRWDFGDGTTAIGSPTPSHAFKDDGTYTVKLAATDATGWTGTDSIVVTVKNAAPVVTLVGPATAKVGQGVSFQAAATDPGVLDQSAGFKYSWDFGDGTTGNGPSHTHAYSSPGTYTVGVTATDKDGASSMIFTTAITVALGSSVPIDAAWIQARGSGPYYLDQADTTYTLQTDVTVPGTAFVVMNKNVVLDLNGHTVTYGASAPIAVPNGDFESSANTMGVPGWDVSAAPSARLAAAQTGMWGSRMLELANISGTETIRSQPIAIPRANVEYAAAVTAKGPFYSSVTLSVIDAVTGGVLKSVTVDPGGGGGLVATFVPSTTNPVLLKIDAAPQAGKIATIDFDNAVLTTSRNYGIVATPAWWYLPNHLRNSQVDGHVRSTTDFTLKNGSVVQGGGRDYAGSALFSQSLVGLTVDGVSLRSNGLDSDTIMATYASDVMIKSSHIAGESERVTNRMRLFAGINLANASGAVTIEDNLIDGRLQCGIVLYRAANDVPDSAVIRGNEIRHDSVATDGYGILINRLANFEIAHNTIAPVNGRGILIDCWNNGVTRDGFIHDNFVEARERPNLEYGSNLTATALRIRNYDNLGAQRNLRFSDNVFAAYTGPGQVDAATGARISGLNGTGLMTGADNLFENNTFKAIVTGNDPDTGRTKRGWGLTIAGAGPGTGVTFRGNVFESNDISLNFGDNDSWQATAEELSFISNTVRKSSEGEARIHQGVVLGDYENTVRNIRLIDMRYEDGASSAPLFKGTKPKNISTGWLLNVSAHRPDGTPVGGATVNLYDRENRLVFTGETDTLGKLAGIAVATTVYSQPGNDPRVITTDARGPFTIEVISGKTLATRTLDLKANSAVDLIIG